MVIKPIVEVYLHPRRLTYPVKNDGLKITFLLGWLVFRGYVKLPGGTITRISYEKGGMSLSSINRELIDPGITSLSP